MRHLAPPVLPGAVPSAPWRAARSATDGAGGAATGRAACGWTASRSRSRRAPSLAGDADVDVAIVGAGFTGLWTAYYLAVLQPDAARRGRRARDRRLRRLRAQRRLGLGRHRGRPARVRRRHGERGGASPPSARRPTASTRSARVVAEEGIDCGFRKGGQLMVATSRAAAGSACTAGSRSAAPGAPGPTTCGCSARRARGARARRRGAGRRVLAALRQRSTRRGWPAGWPRPCERRGVTIYERTPVDCASSRGRVLTPRGRLRARHVLRATEAFTVEQPGERRRYLPLYSLMVATEPLPAEVWDELGWSRRRDRRRPAPPLLLRAAHARRPPGDRRPRRAVPPRLADRRGQRAQRRRARAPGRARCAATSRRPPARASPITGAARSPCRATGARGAPSTPRPASAGAAATPATACSPPT